MNTGVILIGTGLVIGAVILATRKSSAQPPPGTTVLFKAGDYIRLKAHPTASPYVIIAVHMNTMTYDMAQWFQGQVQQTQYGFSITAVDRDFEKISQPVSYSRRMTWEMARVF